MKRKTMKTAKFLICLSLLFAAFAGPIEAKKKGVVQKPVYMVGVAFALVDSAVFITDVQLVDSVTIQKKTKFLMERQLYSLQLQRHLEATYVGGPYVPCVFSSPSKKKMDRRYLSLYKRYVNGRGLRVNLIDQSQFRFKTETYIEVEDQTATPKKKKKKKS